MSSDGSSIRIAKTDAKIERRDRLWLVSENGLKELTVEGIGAANNGTELELNDSIGQIDDTWMAIPLERRQRFSVPVAVGLVLAIALCLGALHGLLVTRLKLQPFVVTLCGTLVLSRYFSMDGKRSNDGVRQ